MGDQYTTKQQISDLQKELEEARKRSASKKTGKPRKPGITTVLLRVLFIVLFLGLSAVLTTVIIAKSNGRTPSVFGYQFYVVQSGSMKPTLNIGTIILSKTPDKPSMLQVGDIVTFTEDGLTITHRIVEVVSDNGVTGYRTKGDNPENAVDTNVLTADRIKAVLVFRIPLT